MGRGKGRYNKDCERVRQEKKENKKENTEAKQQYD